MNFFGAAFGKRNTQSKTERASISPSERGIGKREKLIRRSGQNLSKKKRSLPQNMRSPQPASIRMKKRPRGNGGATGRGGGRGKGSYNPSGNPFNMFTISHPRHPGRGRGRPSSVGSRSKIMRRPPPQRVRGGPKSRRRGDYFSEEDGYSVSGSSGSYSDSSDYTSDDMDSDDITPPRRNSPPMQRPEPSSPSERDLGILGDKEKEKEDHSDDEPTAEDDLDATQLPPGFSQATIQESLMDELPTLDVRSGENNTNQTGTEIPFYCDLTSNLFVLKDTKGIDVSGTQCVEKEVSVESEEQIPLSHSSEYSMQNISIPLEYSTMITVEEISENPVRSLSTLASISRNDKNEEALSTEVTEPIERDLVEKQSREHQEYDQCGVLSSSSSSDEEDRVRVEIGHTSPQKCLSITTKKNAEKKVVKASKKKASSASGPHAKGRKQKINTAVHKNTKRLIDIRSIMEKMNYKALRVTGEGRKAISDAIKFFATKIICGLQDSKMSKENQAKTIKDRDVVHFISTLIPSGPVGSRMQAAILHAVSTRKEFVEKKRSQGKVSESKKAGLCISRAMVKNMCDVYATATTFFKPSYICIAACLEQMTKEIIQRCVGIVLKDTNDFDSIEEVPISRMHTTIELYHVNMALHYSSGIDTIRSYSSNPLFAHRKLDYEEELHKELSKKRNVGRPKMPIKRRVRKTVKEHNSIGLMYPEEIIYHMMVDNVIPILFSDMKFSSAALIPNIRFGMLPDYMVDKYSGRVTGEAYTKNRSESVHMLEFLAQTYYHDAETNTQWKRSRE